MHMYTHCINVFIHCYIFVSMYIFECFYSVFIIIMYFEKQLKGTCPCYSWCVNVFEFVLIYSKCICSLLYFLLFILCVCCIFSLLYICICIFSSISSLLYIGIMYLSVSIHYYTCELMYSSLECIYINVIQNCSQGSWITT